MPMLLFTAQTLKMANPFGGVQGQSTTVQVFEKRTGKFLYPATENSNYSGGAFHALEVDGRNGKIEFLGERAKIVVGLAPDKPKTEAPSAPSPARPAPRAASGPQPP